MECICLVPADAAVHAHARKMAEIASSSGQVFRWSYFEHKKELLRFFPSVKTADLYLLAHSVNESGIVLPDESVFAAQELSGFFSVRKQNIPDCIFLNTCYGSRNGFLEELVLKEVPKIVLSSGSIEKKEAMLSAEQFFELKYSNPSAFEKLVRNTANNAFKKLYQLSGFDETE